MRWRRAEVGTYFLVYTVSVTELILNAVALGIILDIDDLLFDAMATTSGTAAKQSNSACQFVAATMFSHRHAINMVR